MQLERIDELDRWKYVTMQIKWVFWQRSILLLATARAHNNIEIAAIYGFVRDLEVNSGAAV